MRRRWRNLVRSLVWYVRFRGLYVTPAHFSPKLSAAIPGVVYAFLGTSRQLNVAPEAALSLLLGQAVQQIRHDVGEGIPDGIDTLGLAIASIITLQVRTL